MGPPPRALATRRFVSFGALPLPLFRHAIAAAAAAAGAWFRHATDAHDRRRRQVKSRVSGLFKKEKKESEAKVRVMSS